MKKLLLAVLFAVNITTFAQVGIGTTSPSTSSVLDITGTDRGVLLPRIALTGTTDATSITNGNVEGLTVYNTATAADVIPGYYYWSNAKWNLQLTPETGWTKTGNAGTDSATDFIGTTDATDLKIGTAGFKHLTMNKSGSLSLSTPIQSNNIIWGIVPTDPAAAYPFIRMPFAVAEPLNGTTNAGNPTIIRINMEFPSGNMFRSWNYGNSIAFGGNRISQEWFTDLNNSQLGRMRFRTSTFNTLLNQGLNLWGNGCVSIGVGDMGGDADHGEANKPDQGLMVRGRVGFGYLSPSVPTSNLQVRGLVKYASDAAAGSAGLTQGAFYETSGTGTGIFASLGVLMVKQ